MMVLGGVRFLMSAVPLCRSSGTQTRRHWWGSSAFQCHHGLYPRGVRFLMSAVPLMTPRGGAFSYQRGTPYNPREGAFSYERGTPVQDDTPPLVGVSGFPVPPLVDFQSRPWYSPTRSLP